MNAPEGTITLQAGPSRLVLAPGRGGAMLDWHHDGRPVLYPTSAQAWAAGDARGLACYPLVPYSNRIAFGRFGLDGAKYKLAIDPRDRPHAIHGTGWDSAWSVAATTDTQATLTLDHPGDARWPFAFGATQHLVLVPDRLTVTMEIENRADRRAPVGLGLHPFFPRAPGTTLQFAAAAIWEAAPDLLPARRVPIAAPFDHRDGLAVGAVTLDNCFAGWSGPATIQHADSRRVTLTADALFGHLVVYVPQGQEYFAVEPVSHRNDAIHHLEQHDHGLRLLDPGEAMAGEIAFDLTGW